MLFFLFACAEQKCTDQGWIDADEDGYRVGVAGTCAPAAEVAEPDCDDADAQTYPGAPETCNGADDDCDGAVDDDAGDALTWHLDADADGFGGPSVEVDACEAPAGHVADATDCDDADATVSPEAGERCGGGDEDCDGEIDEADVVDATTWYRDDDGDGFGDDDSPETSCAAPDGYDLALGGDCDDGEAEVHPGAPDAVGDSVDADCDGVVTCYLDADVDGHAGSGTVDSSDRDCRDTGEGSTVSDCDDTRADTFPDAPEVAYDGVDQDCDGADVVDVDGDGFDASLVGGLDCDDTDPAVNPDGTERCDPYDVDEDCDGLVDEADPDLTGPGSTWYADADGDGAGDAGTAVTSVCQPDGWVSDASDCDDADPTVRPLATETCGDPVDRNCDGYVGTTDHDGDGLAACEDCDDGDATELPGATELLDGDDDDCDGLVDEYVGDLVLASEADVTSFCASHASVEGTLDLAGLASLGSLVCLRAVSGDLRISGVTATDLRGLDSLTDVGGDMLVGGWQEETGMLVESAFRSLDGLSRLARVGGDLWVAGSEVADLDGAGRLDSVGGALTLLDLPVAEVNLPLTTIGDGLWLEQLPNLTAVSAPALSSFGGSLWLQWLATSSGGFTLDWTTPIPGTLGLVYLPGGANAGWVLPDTVGGLTIEDTLLGDFTGLESLRWVDGDVLINGNVSLTDLSALDGVEEVSGDLALEYNDVLPAWDGFAGLTSVGGWVRLAGTGPASASGFGALERIGEGLDIDYSASLVVIDGFGRLEECPVLTLTSLSTLTDASGLAGTPFSSEITVQYVGDILDLAFLAGVRSLDGSLLLAGNSALASTDGLDSLTTIGGALDVQDMNRLTDVSVPALTEIGGALSLVNLPTLARVDLGALETVGGEVALDELDVLPDLAGFGALREVGGLLVTQLDALVDLGGLDSLTTVEGSLIVESVAGLTSLDGLGALRTVGSDLRFYRNNSLVELAGLDSLTTVGRDLTLDYNPALVRPNSLGALTSIGRDLWVEYNDALVDLAGMGTFTVGNTVYFYGNPALTSLDGLDGLEQVPHHLVLYDLPALTDLGALARLERVGATMRVGGCDSLTTLSGLDALTEVAGSLEVGFQASWGWGDANAALRSLDGLGGLRIVGEDLWVVRNASLVDIGALDTLESVGLDLGVMDNVLLPTADAEALADGTPTVGGTIYISGNL
ncbi:MAG: putative metal-binding motif-containing protein [Pseudomonadota bacterium]|nr:putative metal-binding motif-containing protein [Pseudomonadota bacterium]